jgi:hypothetical protein
MSITHTEACAQFGLKPVYRGITKITNERFVLLVNTSSGKYEDEIDQGMLRYEFQNQKKKPIKTFGATGNNKEILTILQKHPVVVNLIVGSKNSYTVTHEATLFDIGVKDGKPVFHIRPISPVQMAIKNKIDGFHFNSTVFKQQRILEEDILNFIKTYQSSVCTNVVHAFFSPIIKKFSCVKCGTKENLQCAHTSKTRPELIRLAASRVLAVNGTKDMGEIIKQFIKMHGEQSVLVPMCKTCHYLYDN